MTNAGGILQLCRQAVVYRARPAPSRSGRGRGAGTGPILQQLALCFLGLQGVSPSRNRRPHAAAVRGQGARAGGAAMMRPRTRRPRWAAILLATAAWIALAHAKPPPGADPDKPIGGLESEPGAAEDGLSVLLGGRSGRSVSHCRRSLRGVYRSQELRRSAPDDRVRVPKADVRRHDNPTGEAVACWFIGESVLRGRQTGRCGEDPALGLCCVLSDLDFRSAPESRAFGHRPRLDIHEAIEWVMRTRVRSPLPSRSKGRECDGDSRLSARLCRVTGSRWGVDRDHVKLAAARAPMAVLAPRSP